MWVVFITTVSAPYDQTTDFYEVHEYYEDAEMAYLRYLEQGNLVCAGVGQIMAGTEPHWLEEES
jgi:hypothetical protein